MYLVYYLQVLIWRSASKRNVIRNISLLGIIVAHSEQARFTLYPNRIKKDSLTRGAKHLPLRPHDSDAIAPLKSQQKNRCYISSLEYKVITYHQSKLIIADWVGVVSAVPSHSRLSQCGRGTGGGGDLTRLLGYPLGNYTPLKAA